MWALAPPAPCMAPTPLAIQKKKFEWRKLNLLHHSTINATFQNVRCKRKPTARLNGIVTRLFDVVGVVSFAFYSCYLFLSFFVSYRRSSLNADLNQTLSHVRKWGKIENACPKFGVVLSIKFEVSKHLTPICEVFRRLRNLTITLTANVFVTKHDIDDQRKALETIKSLLHCPKTSWTKIRSEFVPTLCFSTTSTLTDKYLLNETRHR